MTSSQAAFGLTCFNLDGAYVIAQDETYLGFFGGRFASDSINNEFGSYGSQFSTTSVRNQFSSYGSQFALYSVNNEFTITPPGIYKNGILIGYLTRSRFIPGGVSLAEIDASCSFFSAFPEEGTISSGSILPANLSGLIASNGAFSSSVFLSWNAAAGASNYNVYLALTEYGERRLISSTNSLSLEVVGIVPHQTYYFFVFPENSAGTSAGQFDTGYAEAFESSFDIGSNQLTISCVEMLTNGFPSAINGYTKYSIIMGWNGERFTVSGLVPLESRASCSGRLEFATSQYIDRVRVGSSYYRLALEFDEALNFSIVGADIIE
jgi:hypothetical protein